MEVPSEVGDWSRAGERPFQGSWLMVRKAYLGCMTGGLSQEKFGPAPGELTTDSLIERAASLNKYIWV